VFEGGADEVATPRTAEERENYEAVVALAVTRTTVRGARHTDMREVPVQAQRAAAASGAPVLAPQP
jgi:hypothetical protein